MKWPTLQSLMPQRWLMASAAVALVTIVLKTAAWYITASVGLLASDVQAHFDEKKDLI
ncbi:MAG: hypothetical protein M3Q12_13690 [Pseudomonadota bacterium]|uniref:hypothetical protein n=1 Tax=Polaromonas sp. TaxID=1869339 RepID=UPI001841AAEE|nr:hypothetical protein [Polaromonas sp.]MBA3595460.1 hypothetical protein [Polaromonas sp.]MDQ3273197.1 hypothetical protein [Pseudomonadota bacterium]